MVGVELCFFSVSILYFGFSISSYLIFMNLVFDSRYIVLCILGPKTLMVHFHGQKEMAVLIGSSQDSERLCMSTIGMVTVDGYTGIQEIVIHLVTEDWRIMGRPDPELGLLIQ